MSQILAWCLNLGRGENDWQVSPDDLLPDAVRKEKKAQTPQEMARIGQALAAQMNAGKGRGD